MLRKILKVLSAITLTLFSFYYTSKIANFTKSIDNIMVSIQNVSNEINEEPIDVTINGDYVTSGIAKKNIDVDKSYEKMKSLGRYNDNLLVYSNILPTKTIENIYDKYVVGGNEVNREVSFIFEVDDINYFKNIISITKDNNIKPVLFIDGRVLSDNKNIIENNLDSFYLENLGYDNEYTKTKIKYTNSLINNLTGKNSLFCLALEENINILNICKSEKMHTILPNVINSATPYSDIKKDLANSKMYFFEDNDYNSKELDSIIKYVVSKGYKFVSLSDLIDE